MAFVGLPEDYTFLIDQDFDDALEREALNQRPDMFMNAVYLANSKVLPITRGSALPVTKASLRAIHC